MHITLDIPALNRIAKNTRRIAEAQEELVELVRHIHPPPGPTVGGVIVFNARGSVHMGEIIVRDDETTLHASITLLDAEGQPTTADDVPVWEVGDPNVLTVHPADDGLSATFDVGAPGASSVTVTTSETHDGVGDPTPIVLTGLVTVTAGDTVTGSVDFATG